MLLMDLLRLLREKATTPSRISGLLGVYLAMACYEHSPLYEPFLASHSEILLPLSGALLSWMGVNELWTFLVVSGNLPATQEDVKALSSELRTIDGRQRRLSDTIGEAYWESDASGKLIFSNYANSRLYGTTSREIVRSGTAPFIHKDDVEDTYRSFKRAIDGKMGFSVEFDVVDRGVSVHTIRVYAWPLFDEDGTFEGHFGSAEIIGDGDDGNY